MMMLPNPPLNSEPADIGEEIHAFISELYPICRSITGNGVRKTLELIKQHIPLEIREVPSGTRVFDWTVPREWNIRDAYVIDPDGKKVIDFAASNLHVVNYSTPVHQTLPLSELKAHLYSLPDHPDWIPYRTSYYKESWGFCLSHRVLESLIDGEYEVRIDSSLESGSLTYGECFIKGESDDEILISTHCCHPSLCNDNLSGIGLATFLAKKLSTKQLRYSYRFIFIPATIGAITWLQMNEERVSQIKHGLVIAGVGDPGKLHYKKSRRGNVEVDRVVAYVLAHAGVDFQIDEFSPYGYDERQFCSPGFNLPVGSLTRTPYGQYPEYHTSGDNLHFIRSEFLADSYRQYEKILEVLEINQKLLNMNPKCEPQLGKRGMYSAFGGRKDANLLEMAMFWVLNFSDGEHSLLDIAEKSGIEFGIICQIAKDLEEHELLKKI
jgi:aminopeptidase-like protein